jgi:hypothetical protein
MFGLQYVVAESRSPWQFGRLEVFSVSAVGACGDAAGNDSPKCHTSRHQEGKMLKKTAIITMAALFFSGCASVPMEDKALSDQAKLFASPPEGQSGLYIYRGSGPGMSLKKDIWVDGECVGESAPNVFFYKTVAGDKDHAISTESEFSPNVLNLFTKSGINYFVRQYIKLGVFVGGANLETVGTAEGENAVKGLSLAQGGNCSK